MQISMLKDSLCVCNCRTVKKLILTCVKNAKPVFDKRAQNPANETQPTVKTIPLRLACGVPRCTVSDWMSGTCSALLKWNQIKINPLIDKDLIKRGWCRLTNGGENPAQAHFLSYSEGTSPSPLRYVNILELDINLACNWHRCKADVRWCCFSRSAVRGAETSQAASSQKPPPTPVRRLIPP